MSPDTIRILADTAQVPDLLQTPMKTATVTSLLPVQKTQTIRLIDVFALGPAMIIVALSAKPGTLLRLSMLFGGVATIVYNLDNYLKQRKQEATSKSKTVP